MRNVLMVLLCGLLFAPVVLAQDKDALKAEADTQRAALLKAQAAANVAEAELATAKGDAKEAAERKVKDAKAAVVQARDALAATVDRMKAAGMEVGPYKAALLKAGGKVDAEAALGLLEEWYTQAKDWISKNALSMLLSAVVFLLILWVSRIVSKIAGRIVGKAISVSRVKVSELLKNFFVNVVQKVIFVFGLLIALDYVGVPTGPFLAGIGVVGFVVGFALQGTLANFAAGIMILMYRPYDIGNVVSAAGITGKVEAMTLVSTTMLTPDNQVHVVPNGKIWGDVITNVTAKPTRRVDLVMGCGYGDDLDEVRAVIQRVVGEHPLVLENPEPVIQVNALGASSVDFIVRPWCKTSDYWAVHWGLTESLKKEFDKAGLNIPYPQRDVHIHQHKSDD